MDVVGVHDAEVAQSSDEELRLGGEVLLDGAVQVEVVAAEVGEHGDIEVRAGDSTEHQRVGRNLHHHSVDAGVAPRCKPALQDRGLGGGVPTRQRAEHFGLPAGVPQHRTDQVGGGRLAVGARHADHQQVVAGMSVAGSRHPARQPTGVGGDHLGHRHRQFPLAQDRCGTGRHRCRSELMPVDMASRQAAKQRSRNHLSGIDGDVADDRLVRIADDAVRRPAAEFGEDRRERTAHVSPRRSPHPRRVG